MPIAELRTDRAVALIDLDRLWCVDFEPNLAAMAPALVCSHSLSTQRTQAPSCSFARGRRVLQTGNQIARTTTPQLRATSLQRFMAPPAAPF